MLQLRSSSSDTEVQFSHVRGDYFRISITSPDHCATREVYTHTDALGVARLFAEAAQDWKGWDGCKVWESLEGELRLELSTDRLGHVFLRAHLYSDPGRADPWQLDVQICLDAGQLEEIAARAGRLWMGGGRPS